MSQSTKTKQEGTLSTKSNVEETLNKQSNLVKIESIENTPFVLVRILKGEEAHEENVEWFIGYSGERITDTFKTKEEALNQLETNKWELIFHLVIVSMNRHDEFKRYELNGTLDELISKRTLNNAVKE